MIAGDSIVLNSPQPGQPTWSGCAAEDVVDRTDPSCAAQVVLCRRDLLEERLQWVCMLLYLWADLLSTRLLSLRNRVMNVRHPMFSPYGIMMEKIMVLAAKEGNILCSLKRACAAIKVTGFVCYKCSQWLYIS